MKEHRNDGFPILVIATALAIINVLFLLIIKAFFTETQVLRFVMASGVAVTAIAYCFFAAACRFRRHLTTTVPAVLWVLITLLYFVKAFAKR